MVMQREYQWPLSKLFDCYGCVTIKHCYGTSIDNVL